MSDIEIYSTAICPYCVAAKNLLKAKSLQWRELRIDRDPAARAAMLERSGGRRSVPQIFVNGVHIGGFDELAAAEHSGKLSQLLASAPQGSGPV
ncbi:MAG: glutaredoxin 3 [Rhodanobacteraceae bacterium]